jgi:hypothetical protein
MEFHPSGTRIRPRDFRAGGPTMVRRRRVMVH